LKRGKYTKLQTALSISESEKNIQMVSHLTQTPPRVVLLIDDALTIVSTADASARKLCEGGSR